MKLQFSILTPEHASWKN